MTATTIKQTEAIPSTYPSLGSPSPLSEAAQALDAAFVWQRLEAYVAHRWTERAVTWVVEGPGEWVPPLYPASVSAAEEWDEGSGAWETVTLDASPLGGYCLPSAGPYRFTATVGGGSPAPALHAAVLQAFVRLAEYMTAEENNPGSSAFSVHVGTINLDETRAPQWLARALQYSGAADLLRPYRKV